MYIYIYVYTRSPTLTIALLRNLNNDDYARHPCRCSAGGGTSACSAPSRESVPAVAAAVVAAAGAAQPMAQEVESAALAQPIKHVPHVGLEDIMATTPATAPPALVPAAMTSAIVQAAVWRSVRCGTACQRKTES